MGGAVSIAPPVVMRRKTMFCKKAQTGFLVVCLFIAAVTEACDYDSNDFASEVVDYVQGSGVGYDYLSLDYYNNPQTALGRPTLETTGDGWYIPEDVSMPVVPVYPPFRAFEVVTIGNGGKLVLRFNHKVSDDENNLYGIDFIVFGNARWRISSEGSWTLQSNPETVTVDSGFFREPGIVSVSQDGVNWYAFSNGPYADDFAPTASYQWDDVNDVWGRELNPTRPVDPNLTPANFNGKSIAEIIEIYNGSAGGTGFDLKWLAPNDYQALTIDPNTGQRWIQYIKIEDDAGGTSVTTEIDAIADVSCCGDYKHPYPVGDLNKDYKVNFVDFAILAQNWLIASNWDDLAALTGNWLYCNWECE
jgi:hypothetical protein